MKNILLTKEMTFRMKMVTSLKMKMRMKSLMFLQVIFSVINLEGFILIRFMAGPAKLVIRAVKFAPSNAMHHVKDLLPLLKAEAEIGIGIVFLKVDNGGDWNFANLVNQVFFCRLWVASKLDVLGIVSYAARFSAYNNIEHNNIKKLTSVILPSVLE